MIKSMTGYGRAEALLEGGKITVEIRSLNSKNADISIKTQLLPKEHEMQVRSLLATRLKRGTIDLFMNWEPNAGSAAQSVNTEVLKGYISQVMDFRCSECGCSDASAPVSDTLLAAILRFPDVVDSKKSDIVDEKAWPSVLEAIEKAIDALDAFRTTEGAALYKDVTSRVAKILSLEDRVESMEGERIEAVKERLTRNLAELAQKVDPVRFEQEIVYYLEKLDINEEKVRLRQHCRYFLETIDSEGEPGKKLGFIIQEMGREINTTGSKSNHAEMQKAVVQMKDELEKIREQSLNIL